MDHVLGCAPRNEQNLEEVYSISEPLLQDFSIEKIITVQISKVKKLASGSCHLQDYRVITEGFPRVKVWSRL